VLDRGDEVEGVLQLLQRRQEDVQAAALASTGDGRLRRAGLRPGGRLPTAAASRGTARRRVDVL